jgi:hypothetical protein
MSDEHRARVGSGRTRLLAEFIVISLGVLMALAADAAWDERGESIQEADYLVALRIELAAASDELAEDHRERERTLARADSLVSQFDERTADTDAIARWTEDLTFRLRKFAPPSAVLDDLVSTGSLSLLASSNLRFGLMEYRRQRERLAFLEERVLAVTEGELVPFMVMQFEWVPPETRGFPRSPTLRASDVRRLLDDPVFRNLVLLKSQRLSLLQRRSGGLVETLGALMTQLDYIE